MEAVAGVASKDAVPLARAVENAAIASNLSRIDPETVAADNQPQIACLSMCIDYLRLALGV